MPPDFQRRSRDTDQVQGDEGGSDTDHSFSQVGGNRARLDQLETARQVDGPLGRMFNRISGRAEGETSPGRAAFSRAQLFRYLDRSLELAEDEWFRGTKLEGAADSLMEKLDADGDGQVEWSEFVRFEENILDVLAPKRDQMGAVAASSEAFNRIDDGSGDLSMQEIEGSSRDKLSRGTDHAAFRAQLTARLAVDAIDRDERDKPVSERTLAQEEWLAAVEELMSGR